MLRFEVNKHMVDVCIICIGKCIPLGVKGSILQFMRYVMKSQCGEVHWLDASFSSSRLIRYTKKVLLIQPRVCFQCIIRSWDHDSSRKCQRTMLMAMSFCNASIFHSTFSHTAYFAWFIPVFFTVMRTETSLTIDDTTKSNTYYCC